MIEITIYLHNRPEGTVFDNAVEAARYLWPTSLTRQMQARDELDSFHETANPDRHLTAKRTDAAAFLEEQSCRQTCRSTTN